MNIHEIKKTHPTIWMQTATLRQWNTGAESESILLVPAIEVHKHTRENERIKDAIDKIAKTCGIGSRSWAISLYQELGLK